VSDLLIGTMKPTAARLVSVVAARDCAALDSLLRGTTETGLRALIVMLAEAADPAKLAELTDYCGPIEPQAAHMIHERMRVDHAWIPEAVRAGEREYQAARRRAQRRAVA
jgi:hypothetical protein